MVLGRGDDAQGPPLPRPDAGHSPGAPAPTYDTDIIEVDGVRYTLAVIQALCIILAAVGNAFVVYFIARYRSMRRNATAFLILNLALCDLVGAVLQQPMRLVDILLPFANPDSKMNNWGETYCRVTGFNSTFISSAGFITVVAIALERVLLICYPLKAKTLLTRHNITMVIAATWGIAFITTLPLPLKFTYVAHARFKDVNVTICMQDILSVNSRAGSEYYMFIFLLYFVVPVAVISVCYSRVFYVLYSRISSVEIQNPVSRKVMLARKRLARMMLFIACIFTVLHGPYFITYFMIACGLGIPHNAIFCLVVLETLPVVNAAINPFIYSAHSRSLFKKKMVSFLGGQYEDSSVYRKDSSGSRRQISSKADHAALLSSFRKSNATDTTSMRTDTTSLRTGTASADVSRADSFRTQESASLRSDSFRMADADSLRRDEYLDTTKDSSFSQDERIPLSQIEEETEIH